MTMNVETGIELIRSSCHRSTWLVFQQDCFGGTSEMAGPFNVAKRAAEAVTERDDCGFEWVQHHADRWVLHIIEPDG